MTIVDQLVDDHAFFNEKFKELEALSSDPNKEQTLVQASALVQGFSERHRLHLKRESSVLFPALLGYLDEGQGNTARVEISHHLRDEHMGLEHHIHALEQDLVTRPPNAEWPKSFRSLTDVFTPHMRNEEEHIFPEAVRLMPHNQLETMSQAQYFPAF
ncbi:MAG: hemerythrin domain-containing protein [Elusimicrobia bacterium]|nr:hemerythrin domain-containing protein [Elusimicrobiota bacterium]